MITSTEADAFRAIVDDNRLLETALLDVCDVIVRRMISGRQPADAIISLDNLRRRLELEKVKP